MTVFQVKTQARAGKHRKVRNSGLKLALTADVLEFLRDSMKSDEQERVCFAEHCKAKGEAGEQHAKATDKTATAGLILLKAELLLNSMIRCSELGIQLPPELLAMLKE